MRVLITGVGGFVGGHLSRHILSETPNATIHGTLIGTAEQAPESVTPTIIDLRDEDATTTLVESIQPDHIYHLAAQAFVPRSFEDPWETLENNIRAQLSVIRACLKLNIRPRIVIISSAEIYGIVQPHELPLREDAPFRPSSPYSVSKVTQDMLGLQYFLSHKLPMMRARPFNHIGPGQNARFVAPNFAMQIARIEAGLQDPVIQVGDLTPQRDFTDVRDIVYAYRLIMERGTPGDVYNIASGKAYSIQYLLDTLLTFTTVEIQVSVDAERLRPTDLPILQGDASHLHDITGWKPKISFEQTLLDVLNDFRQRVKAEGTTS